MKRTSHYALRTGFSLIELMVVIAVIILVAATAMPTLTSFFTAGQDQQAFNLLSAQLSSARALAITKGTYAGVHVQMADNPDFAGKCYTAIVWDNPSTPTHEFVLADGYQPQAMPGTMAFGQISSSYVTSGNYNIAWLGDPSDPKDPGDWSQEDPTAGSLFGTIAGFTTFTIIFNPAGEVVTTVNGANATFGGADTDLMKNGSSDFGIADETRIWRIPPDEPGVLAVTMFDYKVVRSLSDRSADTPNRKTYLDEFGQFLALNLYTGKFFHRE